MRRAKPGSRSRMEMWKLSADVTVVRPDCSVMCPTAYACTRACTNLRTGTGVRIPSPEQHYINVTRPRSNPTDRITHRLCSNHGQAGAPPVRTDPPRFTV
ncbi:hypothetical protein DPEC_G00344490 [Dallia pectoralis]|uniref:Uncharacterized protein n=1 Tax=Dallia pectoralis TaxID=75939 RepID=A0ACC2F3E7_DALPE|nr:hypothetical protein DPEC_G00344490 [Dallia pectoralis]